MKHYKTPIHTFSIAANASTLYPRSLFNQSARHAHSKIATSYCKHTSRGLGPCCALIGREPITWPTNWRKDERTALLSERVDRRSGMHCGTVRVPVGELVTVGLIYESGRRLTLPPYILGGWKSWRAILEANALVMVYNRVSLWRIYTGPWAQLVVQSRTPQNLPKTFQTNFASKFSFPKILFGSLCDHSPFSNPPYRGFI